MLLCVEVSLTVLDLYKFSHTFINGFYIKDVFGPYINLFLVLDSSFQKATCSI